MNIRPWVFSIVLGAGCTALRAAPQKIASGHAENLENCLEGFASCDYAQLNPQEKQAVRGARAGKQFFWTVSTDLRIATKNSCLPSSDRRAPAPVAFRTLRVAWTASEGAIPPS